jgi:uncharacterized damage-inducible protein DinB
LIRLLGRLLKYDAWANRETLDSLRIATPPPRSLRWIAHIIGAEYLWLARLRRESATLAVWPELELEACEKLLAGLNQSWPEYLENNSHALEDRVPYTNSRGEAWTSTVEEILIHVTIHSAYHRGQIATELRAAGLTPAYTDYIHAVRQGHVG